MVAATYDAAMVRVFADEGGYSDDAHDPGGATNFGITIIDARKYWKPNATKLDVKNMPKSVASDIYRKHYADPMHYDELPAGVDYSVLDAAINSGTGRAPQWLAKALGISPAPIASLAGPALRANDKVALIERYWNYRLSFLKALTTWQYFGKGWGRRVAQGEAAAVRMWLSVGAQMPASQANAKMQDQAKKAKTAATSTGAGTGGVGTGATASASFFDWSHMGLGGKVAICVAIAGILVLLVYLGRRTLIHLQRSEAYATS